MKDLIARLATQIEEALVISKDTPLAFSRKKFSQVYVSGLGGSGIGATIVQDYVKDKIDIPFTVNKSYNTHNTINTSTLFIACSYSGNTEETLAAVKKAIKAKATIVCITSGGFLATIAKKDKLGLVIVPGGMPPRSCLGYSLVQQLHVLHQAGLLKEGVAKQLKGVSNLLQKEASSIKRKAKTISKKMFKTIPIIYTTVGYEGLAVRFRQQLNENSKMLAWHNVIPEMTHNEILGWQTQNAAVSVLEIKDMKASAKNKKRMDFLLNKVVKKKCKNITTIEPKGTTYWQQFFYHTHLQDWISWELSLLNKADATEIVLINQLKSTMGEKSKK
jgi:glucose/mannose-6-phosphate isomerase